MLLARSACSALANPALGPARPHAGAFKHHVRHQAPLGGCSAASARRAQLSGRNDPGHSLLALRAYNFNRGPELPDRVIAALPFLLPLLDALPYGARFWGVHAVAAGGGTQARRPHTRLSQKQTTNQGRYIFMQYPYVARILAPLAPLQALYTGVPFAGCVSSCGGARRASSQHFWLQQALTSPLPPPKKSKQLPVLPRRLHGRRQERESERVHPLQRDAGRAARRAHHVSRGRARVFTVDGAGAQASQHSPHTRQQKNKNPNSVPQVLLENVIHPPSDGGLGLQLYISCVNTVFLFVAVSCAYGVVRFFSVLLCCLFACFGSGVANLKKLDPPKHTKHTKKNQKKGSCLVGQTPRLPLVAEAADAQVRG